MAEAGNNLEKLKKFFK
jgi:Rrf2 family protein